MDLFDYRGRQYDPSTPVFIILNETYCHDRLLGRKVVRSSLPWTLSDPEIGAAPDWYRDANHLMYPPLDSEFGAIISGVGSPTASVQITGGVSGVAGTATLTVNPGGGDQVFNESVIKGMTDVELVALFAANPITGATFKQAGNVLLIDDDAGSILSIDFSFA